MKNLSLSLSLVELFFVEVRKKGVLGNYGVEPKMWAGMGEVRFMAVTEKLALHTAQMSVLIVFCGRHLQLAFQFVCALGEGGAANKLEGKWKLSPGFGCGLQYK